MVNVTLKARRRTTVSVYLISVECRALYLSSGVAAIWTFWIYPGAAESEGAAKVGLKEYIVETILNFQKYSGYKVFRVFLIFVPNSN